MESHANVYRNLALEEKVRVAAYANSLGFVLLPLVDEVRGLEPQAVVTIPASRLTVEHFPRASNSEFEALKGFYATIERSNEVYPPLGYAPNFREKERTAAALVSFTAAFISSGGSIPTNWSHVRLLTTAEASALRRSSAVLNSASTAASGESSEPRGSVRSSRTKLSLLSFFK